MLAHGCDCGLDTGRVEIVLFLVIIRRRRDNGEVDVRIRFLRVERRMEVERAFAGHVFIEKIRDYRIDDRAFAMVQQIDLLGNDVERVNLVMLGKQQCDGQPDIAGACNCDLHSKSAFPHRDLKQL